MKNRSMQSGFTLIELIITLAVLGIVANVSSMMIYQASQAASRTYGYAETRGETKIALARIIEDIHGIRARDDITLNTTQLNFVDFQNRSIEYLLSGTTLQRNTQPILKNVTGFTVNYLDQNGIETTQQNEVVYIQFTLVMQNGFNRRMTVLPGWIF